MLYVEISKSPVIPQILEGMLPDNELTNSLKYFKDLIDAPKDVGTVPVNRLLSMYKNCRLDSDDSPDGMEPVRQLFVSLKLYNRLS